MQSSLSRYGVAIAILCVTTTVGLALLLRPAVMTAGQLSLVAIVITGWLCGLRPALLAWGLATLAFTYFFTPPLDSLRVDLTEAPRLAIFALLGLFMAMMSAARRRTEDSLEKAREGLEARVRERTADLEQSNRSLRESEGRLLAQHTVTQILAEAATLEEATPRILRAVCGSLDWDVGALWRRDREAGVLRCVEIWCKQSVDARNFAAASRAATFERGIGLPGRVWFNREPLYIPDIVRDANFLRAPVVGREVLHAALGFPILLSGDVLGVMEFFSHEIRQPDQVLLDMMATIGSQIGQFIERKTAEEALRRTQAELTHVTRVTTLGQLAASIAHEVNQPLAAIVADGNACLNWLADAEPDREKLREALDAIVNDGHRAGDVIQRIRQLATKTEPRRVRLDLNEVVRDVLPLVRAELRDGGVSLMVELAPGLGPVLGDRVQLQQVILNLVMNSIDAMAPIEERSRELTIRTQRHDADHVTVAVHDTGVGIVPDDVDRLFSAFFTTKPSGMGMGLSISRSIIEAHGGRLWATANLPHGAIFQFSLVMDLGAAVEGHVVRVTGAVP